MGRRTKQVFFKKKKKNGKKKKKKPKHMKRCSVSLIIREMQVKTTAKYRFTLVRMAAVKKSTNRKCWRGVENRRSPPALLVGM